MHVSRRFILAGLLGLAAAPALAQGLGFGLGMHDVVARAGGGAAPLDSFTTPSGAYSFRKLKSTYAGPAMRIRRASDSLELDIGFTAEGDFNTAAAAAHCAATTCSVRTLYDQSGNARHMEQVTPAGQPALIFSCNGTLPCLQVAATAQVVASAISFIPATGMMSVNAVGNRVTGTGACAFVRAGAGGFPRIIGGTGVANQIQLGSNGGAAPVPVPDNTWWSGVGVVKGVGSSLQINSLSVGTGSVLVNTGAAGVSFPGGTATTTCNWTEGVVWDNYELTQVEKDALIANQQNYWFSAQAILANATLDYNFATGTYAQAGTPACTSFATCVTFTRSHVGAGMLATNLVYTAASGAAYTTYAADVPRIVSGSGLLVEANRTNRLLNSTVPATQTTASLATGNYVLWVNGAGSAQATAGTAVGSGFGGTPASQGAPKFFAISTAGTVTVTVTGSLNAFQLELGDAPSSFIVTAAAVGSRSADVAPMTSAPTIGSAYSIFCQGIPLTPTTFAASQTLASVSDGTTSNHVMCRRLVTSAKAGIQSNAWGFTDAGAAIAEGGSAKMATAVDASMPDEAAAFSSGDFQQGAAGAPSGLNTIKFGMQGNNSVQWNGFVSRIAFWPTRLSNADLVKVVQ